jgi:hypothetical protein
MRNINGNAFNPFYLTSLVFGPRVAAPKCAVALAMAAAALFASPAEATTFNLSTLNDYQTGSGRQVADHGDYTGINGTGTYVFSSTGVQQNPWTEGTGTAQASINFSVPTMGNNAGKIYMSAGALFPIPTGQTLGQHQSGYSGDYNLGNGYPLYFAFSNPTYDVNCGFNCNTITQVPVTMNSLYITGGTGATITGYSDLGHTVVDTLVITGSGLQQISLNWTGIEEIAISGGSYYVNDIEVNDPIAPAVPELSTWAMFVLGFTGIGLLGYRRQNFRMV